MNVGGVGPVHDPLDQLRRNEADTFGIADHHIARHDSDVADANWNVHRGHRDSINVARMHAAEVSRHVDLADAFQVADTSIHHQAAALGGPHDVMEEIVADDGAAFLLSVDVHHQDVAGLQHVDHGLVPQVVDAFGAGLVVHHGVQVGARRHESHGDGPADHFLGGMENLPAAGVLAVGVAAAATRALSGAAFSRRRSAVGPIDDELFTGKAARAFQQAVGNLGTPVGEAISGPGWRVFDHLLAGPGPQLCVGGRGR